VRSEGIGDVAPALEEFQTVQSTAGIFRECTNGKVRMHSRQVTGKALHKRGREKGL
jgi:hypothetical protein